MQPCTSHSSSPISAPSLQSKCSRSLSLRSADCAAITPDAAEEDISEDFISISCRLISMFHFRARASRSDTLYPTSAPVSKQISEFAGERNSGLRTHFGYGKDQIRRGTAKQEKAPCSGATSRLMLEKITAGG